MNPRFFLAAIAATFLLLSGCRTVKEPAAPVPSVPEPPPSLELQPFFTEWAGTTWILQDPRDQPKKEYPGYRGFHLGGDGRLLLINLDNALGDIWNAEGNRLHMELLEGNPSLPLEGFFLAYQPDSTEDEAVGGTVLLRPEAAPDSPGLVFQRGKANVDIVESHWIPKRLAGGDEVMWPMGREIHLILLPDAVGGTGLLGYGGVNRFRGGIHLTEESFIPDPIAITKKTGPAADFENLFVRRIAEATRYVQVDNDLFLYKDTQPVALFQVRLFN